MVCWVSSNQQVKRVNSIVLSTFVAKNVLRNIPTYLSFEHCFYRIIFSICKKNDLENLNTCTTVFFLQHSR